jgi:hypothetical protein
MDTPVNKEQVIFEMGASAKNYTNDYKSLDATGLNRNAKAKHDIGLKPYSWVEVNVRKTNSKDSTAISIGGSWVSSTWDNVNFVELIVNEKFVRRINGNTDTKISYRLRSGFKEVYKETETKYAATHDTVKFFINY